MFISREWHNKIYLDAITGAQNRQASIDFKLKYNNTTALTKGPTHRRGAEVGGAHEVGVGDEGLEVLLGGLRCEHVEGGAAHLARLQLRDRDRVREGDTKKVWGRG
jgi:hypothetical protein